MRLAGILDLGLGMTAEVAVFGWHYGKWRGGSQVCYLFPLPFPMYGQWLCYRISHFNWYGSGFVPEFFTGDDFNYASAGLFPAVIRPIYLAKEGRLPYVPWHRRFNIELSVHAGIGVRVGFSLGEFLDFILGIFGIDIAGDDKPTIVSLKERLLDDDSLVRASAAKSLGEEKEQSAVTLLCTLLMDEVREVRWASANALGEIGDERAIKPLIDSLKVKDGRFCFLVTRALKKITKECLSEDYKAWQSWYETEWKPRHRDGK
jgi:hypothetical protein